MAKKRSMPHGRTIPKAKRAKLPAAPTPPATEEGESSVATNVAAPPPASSVFAPRSVLRPAATRGGRTAPGLSTDYRYVLSDLKHIGVIASATVAVLVILTFVVK